MLYFREAAGRDSDEFYANPEIGEFWTGPRPSRDDVAVRPCDARSDFLRRRTSQFSAELVANQRITNDAD